MDKAATDIEIPETRTAVSAVLSLVASHTRLIAWSVFALGLAVFLVLRIGLILLPMQARSAPIEADDAYNYILKAVQMESCFRQDCPALEDLRTQLTAPSPHRGLAGVRGKEYWRGFFVYHPLHSALLVLLHRVGLSWEEAYETIQLAGAIVSHLIIAYWLVTLWGPGPAGITLALLAFMPSFSFARPNDFALGAAMLVWARLSAREGAAEWSLALGTLAMVAMHPMGRVYAIASIVLFLLFTRRQAKRTRSLVAILFSVLIIGVSFLLPFIVNRPELRGIPYGLPTDGLSIARNLGKFGLIVMETWAAHYGSIVSAVIITALGFLSLPPVRRSAVVKNSLVLAGLLMMSLLYVFPGRSAELSERVWIPMAILLTGAVGQVAWHLLIEASSHLVHNRQRIFSELARLRTGFAALPAMPTRVLVFVFAGVLVAIRVELGIVHGVSDIRTVIERRGEKQRFALELAQPKFMLSQARSSDMVLYLDEVPMHFYLTHGAIQMRALYYPALVHPSEAVLLVPERKSDSPRIYRPVATDALAETAWLKSEAPRFLVGWNPIQQLPESHCREAMIDLAAFSRVEYVSREPIALEDLRLSLVNRGGEASLRVMPLSEAGDVLDAETIFTRVSGGWSGWVKLPMRVSSQTNRFRLDVGGAVFLTGMRVGDSELSWPWDQRATLLFHGKSDGLIRSIRFDPDELFPVRGLPVSVRILNDRGPTLLAEFVRSSSNSALKAQETKGN